MLGRPLMYSLYCNEPELALNMCSLENRNMSFSLLDCSRALLQPCLFCSRAILAYLVNKYSEDCPTKRSRYH